MGMAPTIDHAGPLTASVAENALFLEAMAGEDGLDPRQKGLKLDHYTKALGQGVKGLKIALIKEGLGQHGSHPGVDAGGRAAAQIFERLGAKVSEVSLPWHLTGVPIWGPIA